MWFNPMMKWLLRSPFHGLMDKGTLVIGYQGRKSGKTYETPVNYVQSEDDLLITSLRQRTWWRNLLGGASVVLTVKGKEHSGTAEAFTGQDEVARYLGAYLQQAPKVARYFDVSLDSDGQPDASDIRRAALERVMVRVRLAA